jgi:hypothetical protein
MLLKTLIPAALLSVFMLSPAVAAPISPEPSLAPLTVDVQMQDKDRDRRADRKRPHYRPGGHYRHSPRGWHRYHRRPRDWRTRGCIVVGPIWFCP